jgi:hypothetical protein
MWTWSGSCVARPCLAYGTLRLGRGVNRDKWNLHVPWVIYIPILKVIQFLQWLLNVVVPPPLRLHDLVLGGRVISHVVLSLTELGVPDALTKGPRTAQELAVNVGE